MLSLRMCRHVQKSVRRAARPPGPGAAPPSAALRDSHAHWPVGEQRLGPAASSARRAAHVAQLAGARRAPQVVVAPAAADAGLKAAALTPRARLALLHLRLQCVWGECRGACALGGSRATRASRQSARARRCSTSCGAQILVAAQDQALHGSKLPLAPSRPRARVAHRTGRDHTPPLRRARASSAPRNGAQSDHTERALHPAPCWAAAAGAHLLLPLGRAEQVHGRGQAARGDDARDERRGGLQRGGVRGGHEGLGRHAGVPTIARRGGEAPGGLRRASAGRGRGGGGGLCGRSSAAPLLRRCAGRCGPGHHRCCPLGRGKGAGEEVCERAG